MTQTHSDRSQAWKLDLDLTPEEARAMVRAALSQGASSDDVEWPSLTDASDASMLEDDWSQMYSGSWVRMSSQAFEWDSQLVSEAQVAGELFDELMCRPLEQQRLMVCNDPRFQSWPLCELLLDRSWQAGFQDPNRSLQLAEIAVSVAYELDVESCSAPLTYDLKARAWAMLGNARRIRSDLRGAEKAFDLADSLLQKGSGEPLEKARVYELKASLCRDTNRLRQAEKWLERASILYHRAEDHHREGRVVISQGLLAGHGDRLDDAIRLLRRGLSWIEPEREPRLMLVATHNLCLYLNEKGQYQEALRLLSEARELHRKFANELDLVRLRWLEGKIALAAGRVEDAESALVDVRRAFIDHEIGFDAAWVSLDLAGVYARQGRATDMRQLAEETLPIFQSLDLHTEAMAALIVFQKAAHMETVSATLIEELSGALLRAQNEE